MLKNKSIDWGRFCHILFSIKIGITYVRKSFLGCGCNSEGSRDQFCDVDSGHCFCNEHVDGDKCDKCDHSYFNFPNCEGRTFFHQ